MRDGEQSPGASMTKEEKLRIARQLERMRVDVIEAGFPAASDGDFEAVQAVAEIIKDSTVCGLARANDNDIAPLRRGDQAGASPARIHTFIATSPIHMEKKLRMEPDAGDRAGGAARCSCAREYTDDVEFSPEDAGRSDLDFLCRMLEAVIEAGATTINIPDTVGYTLPEHFGELIRTPARAHPEFGQGGVVGALPQRSRPGGRQFARRGHDRRAPGRVHDQRPGRARRQRLARGNRHGGAHAPGCLPLRHAHRRHADRAGLASWSRSITGFPVQPNKAIVGANAFAHESGIHQDGVLKHRETYEIMRAEDVGWNANKLVLGKHSGRNAFKARLQELGIELESEEALNAAFKRFKDLADKKHEIFDEDMQALISDEGSLRESEHYKLVSLGAHSETGEARTRTWSSSEGGTSAGARPRAAGRWTPLSRRSRASPRAAPNCCCTRSIHHQGTESQGEVTVRLRRPGASSTAGADTDIVVASAKAYIQRAEQAALQGGARQPAAVGV